MSNPAAMSDSDPAASAATPSGRADSAANRVGRSISGREWCLLAVAVVAVSLLGDLPYWLARHDLPEFARFVERPAGMTAVYPSILAAEDYPQYLGAIRDAAESGSIVGRNHFSTEPHEPIVLRPFYSVLGWVGGMIGVGEESMYRLAVLFSRALFLIVAYAFISAFFHRRRERAVGWLLLVFVSGLAGWLVTLQGALPVELVERYRTGYERTEFNSFTLLFHHPHLAFAMAMILLSALTIAAILAAPSIRKGLLLALLLFLLSGSNLFSLVPLGVVAACMLVWQAVSERRIPVRALASMAIGGAGGLPFLVYAARTYAADPFWSATYGKPLGQASPPADVVLFHLLPLAMLATVGALGFWRSTAGEEGGGAARSRIERRLIGVWLLASVVLMYLPVFDFRIRLAFGLQPVLALLATRGAVDVVGALGSRGLRVVVVGVGLVVVLATPVAWTMMMIKSVRGVDRLFTMLLYRPDAEVEGARWLAEQVEADDAVVCSYPSGNFLAGILRGSVYVGHDSGTMNCEAKKNEVSRFYTGGMSAAEAGAFLDDNGIDFVYYSVMESRGIGSTDLSAVSDRLELAHQTSAVQIFRVR